jgi:transposase-like protein
MLERLMGRIKRRTLVVRILPNTAACLRLVRALGNAQYTKATSHENSLVAG